jgi:tryptophanyl-tRNA synthetase
MTRDVA